jgi:hypothetical protein
MGHAVNEHSLSTSNDKESTTEFQGTVSCIRDKDALSVQLSDLTGRLLVTATFLVHRLLSP